MAKSLFLLSLLAASFNVGSAANCGAQDLLTLTGGLTFENKFLYAGREAMCGHDACSVQPNTCIQGMRLSNDFKFSMTAVDPNSKWTHCYDAFLDIIQSCFDKGYSNSEWDLDGEFYYVNITKDTFIPYVFQPDQGNVNQQPFSLPYQATVLTAAPTPTVNPFIASASEYSANNPPYTTNGQICTPVYADHPVCRPTPTPVCGNLGNPNCVGLSQPTVAPGQVLNCNTDCCGTIPSVDFCNQNCGGMRC